MNSTGSADAGSSGTGAASISESADAARADIGGAAVSRRPGWIVPLIAAAAVVGVWQAAAVAYQHASPVMAETRLPEPSTIVATLADHWSGFASALGSTLQGAVIGLFVGIVIAVIVSLASAGSRWVEHTVYPYLIVSQMVPTIVLAPIVLAVVKNGTVARVFVAAFISFFVIAINMTRGLKSVDNDQLILLRSLHARRWQVYTKLRLPASLPFFFTGLKVAAPLSVVGEIVVELTGAQRGLGLQMLTSLDYGPAQAYVFWAAALLTGALGYAMYLITVVAERRLTPWQPEYRDGT